jgi:hypothetical protein
MSRSILASSPARGRAAIIGATLASACICVAVPAAQAHGFGQRYDLPLPLALYLTGVAAAIVFSFVVVGLLVRRAPPGQGYPRLDLLAYAPVRLIASHGVVLAVQIVSLVLSW